LILQYVEQGNKYNQFDFRYDVNGSAQNAAAARQDVSFYLCPSDPSPKVVDFGDGPRGRSNYFGNIGITANPYVTDGKVAGIFNMKVDTSQVNGNVALGTVKSKTHITDITDGTSNTAMIAEIKRGTLTYNDYGQHDATTCQVINDAAFNYATPTLPDCDQDS